MALILFNLFIGIVISAYFGFTAVHNGFFNPLVHGDAMVKNYSFNFLSPMLWFLVLDIIFIILFTIMSSKISNKTMKVLSILAPIWTMITFLVCLGAYLYN